MLSKVEPEEDDEDGEECAAATKMRRGEDSEEGQTLIVTGGCYDPSLLSCQARVGFLHALS